MANVARNVLFFISGLCILHLVELQAIDCEQDECPSYGNILLPLKKDCQRFLICNYGKTIRSSCPKGYNFQDRCLPQIQSTCIPCNSDETQENVPMVEYSYEDFARDQLSIKNNPNMTISERCTTNSITPLICPEHLPQDSLFQHPDDQHLFYYCIAPNQIPICRDCPADLVFDPVKRICDYAIVLDEPEAVVAESEECQQRNGIYADLRPDPYDCNGYYVCDSGYLVSMSCPPGLYFNPALKACDYPRNLKHFDCKRNEKTKREAKTDADLKEIKATRVECTTTINGEEAELIPDPIDCEHYYLCVWGIPIRKSCPDNLQFNPKLLVCDYPENAGCEISDVGKSPS